MKSTSLCHVVAIPYPGRGHVNPMMNICKLLASQKHDLTITFVVTEEWLGLIRDDPKPDTIRYGTIPNILPSEHVRAGDVVGFYESVMTKMEGPIEQLIEVLEPQVEVIVGDVELRWLIGVGNRRNIPVAALWTMSASYFSMLYHFDVFLRSTKLDFGVLDHIEEIPGVDSSQLPDLKTVFRNNNKRFLELVLDCISKLSKANCLLFTTVYELEAHVMDTLKATFPYPVYSIGPAIPYLELQSSASGSNYNNNRPDYLQWLDSQPKDSVLYVSLGSFLSVAAKQMDEIVAGLRDSGIRFLWVARKEASSLKDIYSDKGQVVHWCDQLKVLCHPSIGGFWTHCGWNSTLESIFAGVPMLTFPLFFDQDSNSRQITEDWRIGWEVKKSMTEELVTRKEIAALVLNFMDVEKIEQQEMRRRARERGELFRQAILENGSSAINLNNFLSIISHVTPSN